MRRFERARLSPRPPRAEPRRGPAREPGARRARVQAGVGRLDVRARVDADGFGLVPRARRRRDGLGPGGPHGRCTTVAGRGARRARSAVRARAGGFAGGARRERARRYRVPLSRDALRQVGACELARRLAPGHGAARRRRAVDAPGWGPWTTKAGVLHAIAPADALETRDRAADRPRRFDGRRTARCGCCRGSHRDGVLADPKRSTRRVASGTAVTCLAARGDVLLMRPLLLHASSKAATADPRRVLHVEYATDRALPGGLGLAAPDA